jgi:hypothetical protein
MRPLVAADDLGCCGEHVSRLGCGEGLGFYRAFNPTALRHAYGFRVWHIELAKREHSPPARCSIRKCLTSWEEIVNGLIYLIGLIVVILFILSFLGLR